MLGRVLRIDTPRAFLPLLAPARYKAAYGGRGGAKSHWFAELLIERCIMQPTRWACIREVQNSLKESVQQLLVDKAEKFGVGSQFKAVDGELRGPNRSLIIFKGMHHYNAETIKSLEGYDGAWVEEAQTFSEKSLRMLRPTIRKEESELWFSWNPRHDTDAVDAFLRGPNKPKDAIVLPVSWKDNPWFPDVLRAEKDHDYATDPDMADHVWGGGYEIISEGAYYARLIAKAESEGRVGLFPFDPRYPVDTAWDLGVDDYTAIWFIQNDGVKAWATWYYETSGEGAEQIITDAAPELLADQTKREAGVAALTREPYILPPTKERPFQPRFGVHYFPHDIANREWGAGARSRLEIVRGLGLTNIRVGIQNGPEDRIAASRRLIPLMAFDQAAIPGVRRLRGYKRKRNETLGVYMGPLHDENSHGADAFGEYAINCPIVPKIAPQKPKDPPDLHRWNRQRQGDNDWITA